MKHPTFKLYRKPAPPGEKQPNSYIGHVVIGTTTYGLLAQTVTEGKGEGAGRTHLEGHVIDWQELIREHVAPSAKTNTNNGQIDLVQQVESQPFDDPLP